jgi:phthiocerol/phenolphthiocerol synthesis type-I polyketide synthase C
LAVTRRADEPIAIIGMAFRFPGDLNDEHSLWQALREGRDVVSEVGPDRWATDRLLHPKRSEPGRSITFAAGVLSRIDEFDAAFFGISPREAAWLDPQQRLLLELAWESTENAGVPASSLSGSDCAVFVGISGVDYGMRAMDDLSSMTAHSMTGNTFSIAANRLSYIFDLRGPSVAVDTACSSSLVALHQACNALRSGESSMAMVGGVNLLTHPYPFVGFTKASMLSATGRCRAFDASGDGYVRAEGGAVLLLKPLEAALADGNEVHAIILATGSNADGGRKTGITIPSAEGQAQLMRAVLERSGLTPDDVDYVEAHGTGTPVGDPVEAAAIGEVYGKGRSSDRPMPIGSVKTNLGHLEAAAGMAGLVKSILVLKHRRIPPSLHYNESNPHIDFKALNLQVATSYRYAVQPQRKKFAVGVNSFGFGGANAHAVLQEFVARPAGRKKAAAAPEGAPLFLSARTMPALRSLAGRYAEMLKQQPQAAYDIAYSAALHRDRLENRLALSAGNAEEMAEQLSRFAKEAPAPRVRLEDALTDAGEVAFIYSGNGSQWQGMGLRLMEENAAFAALMESLEKPIQAAAGFSIIEALRASPELSPLADTSVAQPVLFAIQVALTQLLREQGIEPAAVMGHSVGEIAAAWASGALNLDQAITVVCARSAAQHRVQGSGRMAAVGLSAEAARQWIETEALDDVEIAGINDPTNITLAGSLASLQRLGKALSQQNIFFKLLDLEYAFHSRAMDPIKGDLTVQLSVLAPAPTTGTAFISTVTGVEEQGTALNGHYWWQNVRQPVQFASGMKTLAQRGCRIFVEIAPHAILQRYMRSCLSANSIEGRVLPTLRREHDGADALEETVLRAHLLSEPSRLDTLFPVEGRRVRLPNYPWQRERHWHRSTTEGCGVIDGKAVHPLLGLRRTESAAAWESTLDPLMLPWLADHQVGEGIVLPGAAFAEMALAAGRELFGGMRQELEDLDIIAPVVFDAEHARTLRFELAPEDGRFQIKSRQRLSEEAWTLHAAGRLLGEPATDEVDNLIAPLGLEEPPAIIDRDTHYHLADQLGLQYGPAFQGLQQSQVAGDTLQASLIVPVEIEAGLPDYLLHPALLDVCFQTLADFFRDEIEQGQAVALLPVRIGWLRRVGGGTPASLRAIIRRRNARSVLADFELHDAEGRLVARATGCRFRGAPLRKNLATEPALWRIASHLQPRKTAHLQDALPSSAMLAERLKERFLQEEESLGRMDYFKTALPLLEALVTAFALEAFADLFAQKESWVRQALAHSETVDAERRSYFLWLVGLLRRDNLLIQEDDGAWALRDSELPPAETIWHTLLKDFPALLPELVAVGHVGRQLAHWLGPDAPAGSHADWLASSSAIASLLDESVAYRGTRFAAQQVLRDLADQWPADRRLRILEVTAAQNSLAECLAERFPADRLDYRVISPDAEPPAETFDVIVLRHALHRAAQPSALLRTLRDTLAPGGLLMAAERHADLDADFVFGWAPEWWQRSAEAEPSSRLLSPNAWESLLARAGFEQVHTFLEPASDNLAAGAYLLMTKRPAAEGEEIADPTPTSWLLVSAASGASAALAARLGKALESAGHSVRLALGDANRAEQGELLRDIQQVVHLGGVEEGNGLADVLRWTQAAAQCELPPRLWLVGCGGLALEGLARHRPCNPNQGSVWGLGRVAMNEAPALHCTLIDLDLNPASDEALELLQQELMQPDGEQEIVLTPKGRFVPHLERTSLDASPVARLPAERFKLDFRMPGQLRNLQWLPNPARPLADDEVEVRVVAAGLNFRDVMYAMGLLPDEAVENGFAGASLGLEFSGVVTRIGKAVSGLTAGDAVMGFGPSCFASHVVTRTHAVTLKPHAWSFESAATVPAVFLTAYYALDTLANLKPGERVLIHGAAGGVGMAAVQLALHRGAEVFATAGSEEKRDFLKLLGADHVFDSRSLAFADDILQATGGEGVDVVLNSLAGEAIRRNLRILKPFGRFLELGKRDFFENTAIGLRPFRNNISYFAIDADQLLVTRPDLAARVLREVMALFHEDALFPLPFQAFAAGRIVEAFRTLQQARHIGKVVVQLEGAPVDVAQPAMQPPRARFSPDSTWLVTGGLSGFGLESARWLAERGVGHVVLLGRRGVRTPGAVQAVGTLKAAGAQVTVAACDITCRDAVAKVLDEIRRSSPPLKGVLHAAAVIEDGLLENLDAEQLNRVLAPKLTGAWNLHELTKDMPLDYFVLYSSVTTFLGNPGQGNYVAANTALENLAALRRSAGLPATCIAWGPISDSGYLARNTEIRDSLASRLGAAPLRAGQVLALLDRLLASPRATVAAADFDWARLSRLLPSREASRFQPLRDMLGASADAAFAGEDIRNLIAGQSPGSVKAIVQSVIAHEVAVILGTDAGRIELGRNLHDLGMDSLMGVELAVALEAHFGISLPTLMLTGNSLTVSHIAASVCETLLGSGELEEMPVANSLNTMAQKLAAQHGESLSEHELASVADDAQEQARNGARLTA